MSEHDHGKFIWHDLMTPDIRPARAFYTELLGWNTPETSDQIEKAEYVHLRAGEKHIGGMIKLAPAHGAPPHWIGYVSVASVDESVARATASGGKVFAPPRDIDVGRFAVLGDPQGAVFAVFTYSKAQPAEHGGSRPGPGEFCWAELYSADPAASSAFYAATFGWRVESTEMPGFGTYHVFKAGDAQVAGMMQLRPDMPPHPFWLHYVAVDDCDATVARATRLGGAVGMAPMNIENIGRFAVLMDPQHAAIAVLGPNR